MDAGCECAPWVRSANPSDSWALVSHMPLLSWPICNWINKPTGLYCPACVCYTVMFTSIINERFTDSFWSSVVWQVYGNLFWLPGTAIFSYSLWSHVIFTCDVAQHLWALLSSHCFANILPSIMSLSSKSCFNMWPIRVCSAALSNNIFLFSEDFPQFYCFKSHRLV